MTRRASATDWRWRWHWTTLMLLLPLPVIPLAAQIWTGGTSTTWSTAGNWSGGVPGSTATATFSGNTANDPNLTAAATVGRLLFQSGTDSETFTGSNLTLNGVSGVGIDNQSGVAHFFSNTLVVAAAQTWNAGSGNLSFSGVTLNNTLTLAGSGDFDFTGSLLLNGGNRTLVNDSTGTVALGGGVSGANRTLTVSGSGDTAITGAITTGSGGLIKTGAGTLLLSGANTNTGATTVGSSGGASGGTLRTGASDIIANNTVTVFAGALDLDGNSDTIGALNLGGGASGTGASVATGAGTLTLGGNITYTATNNPDGAAISGRLNLGTANRTITVGDSSAAGLDLSISAGIAASNRNLTVSATGNILISGAIATGTGTLTKSGAGTLTLSGANTYTGVTTVSGGVLNIQNSAALGSTAAGTSVTSGEELQLQGGIAVGAEALTLTGTGVSNSGALRNISGANSWAGLITLTGATRIQADADSLTLSGGIDGGGGNRNLTFGADGDITVSGAITTGSGTITKLGSGTLLLSGANTNTGATTINAGTLRLGASEVLSNSTAVTVAGGATFDVNGQTETIASLAGAGQVLIGTGQLISAGNASTTFSGTLAGAGEFIKQGTGTLTLDSVADYTFDGTLTLAGGTLRLSNINLTLGALSITGNTVIDFVGVSSLSVASFSIAGGVTLTISNWADASDYFFAQNWTGATPDLRGAAPMNQITFTGFAANDTKWQAYDDQITPVPEPSAYGALLLLLTGGLAAWRRRRAAR